MEVISKDFCLANLTEPYKEIYTIPFLTEDFCRSVLAEAKEIGFRKNFREEKAAQIIQSLYKRNKYNNR